MSLGQIIASIKSRFFQPSTDAVMAAFSSTVQKLKAVETHHQEQRDEKIEQATKLADEISEHVNESARAVVIRGKLEALLGL